MNNTMTKEELSKLYASVSVREICNQMDVSTAGFYALLDAAKIPRKKKKTKRTKWTLVD